ncbi:hypothetical protein FRB95_008419 [Tulasnella sp. JGI-2019a]|nr:hypothetical protein FRB95_008419 [Tulasnella sp. JGI-2019a]
MRGYSTVISLVLCSLCHLITTQPWNCKAEIGAYSWDLTALNKEKTISRTRSSPPSTFEDEVRFNLCDVIKKREGYDSLDQCPSGTLACFTEVNKKPNDGAERITAVIPLAVESGLNIQYKIIPPAIGLTLLLHGSRWPADAPTSLRQSFNITLLCDPSTESEPKFVSYNQGDGGMFVEWSNPSACAHEGGDQKSPDTTPPPSPGDGPSKSEGGGMRWFFFLLLMGVIAYFGLGAYSNYTNYGSRGWDLVPHRDFWRDVPYLAGDLVAHIVNSIRGGNSRSGYVSV